MPRTTPPQPTAAERAAAQRQNASLKQAKVSPAEARVIASANRSEGSGMKKGTGIVKKAKGGSFRTSANGIAKKGKTKATQVKMACGGKAKMARGGMAMMRGPRGGFGGAMK